MNIIHDNNHNIKLCLLDPLSVIVKLAILGHKPVGTKLLIQNNVIYFQEPGMFQSFCRYVYNSSKTEIQYMYNPIQIACASFLTPEMIAKKPNIKNLFECAKKGLKKLMETYAECSIIIICLNYYYAIIASYIEQKFSPIFFYKDDMTSLYTKELILCVNEQWTDAKLDLVLNITIFLINDNLAAENVRSLENVIDNIDKHGQFIIKNI